MSESEVTPSDSQVVPADRALYEQRMDAVLAALPQTGSVRDLQTLIDRAVEAVEAAHPPFRCRQGCFTCCEDAMPVVTAAEWRELHAAIARQSEDYQRDLHQRTAAAYRQQVDALAVLAARLRGEPAFVRGVETIDLAACAFLQDGKCSAYEARPAMCRAYGYMTVVEETAISPVMCPPATTHIRDTFPEDYLLPRWEPFQATLNRLTRKQAVAHLPLWIMAQHDLGGYRVPPVEDPMTWAVKRMSTSTLVTEPPLPMPDTDVTIGRPKIDQGLGLSLGKPAFKPKTFGFGTAAYDGGSGILFD